MDEQTTAAATQEEISLAVSANNKVTFWNDAKSMNAAWRTATMLSKSEMMPERYRGKPENVIIALDAAIRLNMSPMLVAQHLYVVKGNPGWSGQFCIAAVNGCGKFTPLTFTFGSEGGGSCYASATRLYDGQFIKGATVTMQMANDEGWLGKNGSKWKTMPELMLQYRAAAFFARTNCPEVLLGMQTADELEDVNGPESEKQSVITVEL